MRIKGAQILEEIRYKDKTFLCQIRVVPRAVKYFHGQQNVPLTHRWMRPELWADFDAGLEKILARFDKGKQNSLREEGEHFHLNASVRVQVQATRTPVEALCRCARRTDQLEEKDVAFALECSIEYQPDGNWFSGSTYDNYGTVKELAGKPSDKQIKNEYEPTPFVNIKTKYRQQGEEYDPQAGNVGLYIPYTPSAIAEAASLDAEKEELEPYTLTFKSVSRVDKMNPSPNSEELVYRPTPIIKLNEAKCAEMPSVVNDFRERKKETDADVHKIKSPKKEKKMENDTELNKDNTSEQEKIESENNCLSKQSVLKCRHAKTIYSDIESKANSAECEGSVCTEKDYDNGCLSMIPDKHRKRKSEKPMVGIRRSSRSPTKTKRLIEALDDAPKYRSKSTLPVRKEKLHKELFGSDDEIDASDKDDFVKAAPIIKLTGKLVENRAKNKRKREPLDDCAQEKRYINRWISTSSKSSSRTDGDDVRNAKGAISNDAANDTELYDTFKLPTNAITTNEVKKESERKSELSPVKVEILSLEKMSANEILDSLLNYKSSLDKLFYKLQTEKRYRHGYNGIDHCFVMELVPRDTQMAMLHKLRETYDKNPVGSSGNSTLYINVLLPEWIICLFMEKYNFTREEAIKQIRAQEEYKFHQQEQSNDSITLGFL